MPRFVSCNHSAEHHHGVEWNVELYQDGAAETTTNHASWRPIHCVGTGSQERLSGRVLQWLGEEGDADEDHGWGSVVSGCTVEGRGVSLHVRDRRSSMGDTSTGRRFCHRWVRTN